MNALIQLSVVSPTVYARWAGALALALVVLGPFSMVYVPGAVFVPGDAAATAQQLASAEGLYRLGMVSDLVICLVEVALLSLLYVLFQSVSPVLSLMAATARVVMVAIQAANIIVSVAALVALEGPNGGAASGAHGLLALHAQAVHVWEVVFALHCLVLAVLIHRSGFVPRVFGPLMGLAALGYAANGFGNLLVPEAQPALAAVVAVGAIVGELPFFLWLLFKGIRASTP